MPADLTTPLRHDPLAAVRQAGFRLFLLSRLLANGGQTILQVTVAWQVFRLTGSALDLGLLGLARLLPALGPGLVAGAVADRYDRRRIVLVAQAGFILCAGILLVLTRTDNTRLPLIYAVVLLTALVGAFEEPAGEALLPQLVPVTSFSAAVALHTGLQEIALIAGAGLGGALIAVAGIGGAYAVCVTLALAAALALLPLRPHATRAAPQEVSLAAIREGLVFVWQRRVLLGAMTLDLFAVLFAGATALLPIYAGQILKVGATGYGLLTAAQAVGALLMSAALVLLPPIRRTGRALLLAVGAFGATTVVFGLSRSFPLSLAAFAAVGAADQVSVIMRHTTIQLVTPDALRGRVSSVSSLFIGASNQLGLVESGLVAAATNVTFAVVSGGVGCVAVVAAVAAGIPQLRRFRLGETEGGRR